MNYKKISKLAFAIFTVIDAIILTMWIRSYWVSDSLSITASCSLFTRRGELCIQLLTDMTSGTKLTAGGYVFVGVGPTQLVEVGTITAVPYSILVFIATVVAMFCFWVGNKTRHKSGYCEVCGYDLRASTGVCPECGTTFGSSLK